ncbi:ATP-binding protein [Paractinoplanes globisporus]|uniref:ATP-binding protein n=1 Tax=Paractinoplanes globisporus TaxID=113565 RepID=A0ABW6WI38_9ACTN|nr:ATP-binding protein [Actinoplanes globisporus]
MTSVTALSLCPEGILDRLVLVSAETTAGGGRLDIAGPDGAATPELRDRVYAGIINSGLTWRPQTVTVAVNPLGGATAHACADLAVAAAILAATGYLPATALDGVVFLGELGLDGAIRTVRETLKLVASAAELGYSTVVVPAGNAAQARLVPGIRVVAAETLHQVVRWATTGEDPVLMEAAEPSRPSAVVDVPDLVQLPAGWRATRFALQIAAAGGHHVLFTGPAGEAVLAARCLPSLLPDLDDPAALQVSALHAAAGLTVEELIRRPPLLAPHCSSSFASVLGGRKPGAVSLAHRGVLLLEDASEFDERILRALRQPLDSGIVQLARARGAHTYPAGFQMMLTCRTGHGSAVAQRAYRARLAGIADRADMTIAVGNTPSADAEPGEASAPAAARVAAARAVAADRWRAEGYATNADIPLDRIQQRPFRLPPPVLAPAARLREQGAISNTGYGQIARLAWTIADLDGLPLPGRDEVERAIQLRRGEAHD